MLSQIYLPSTVYAKRYLVMIHVKAILQYLLCKQRPLSSRKLINLLHFYRTPPYKDRKTPDDVQVYIELVRPSDGRTSEPKDFKYKAEQAYKQIKKRKTNSSFCSIGSSSSKSIQF